MWKTTVAPTAEPGAPQSLSALADGLLAGAATDQASARPAATGFDLLDRVLDGGLRVHDLMLIGGTPGVGKTVAALQMARSVAQQDRPALYVCYEHDAAALYARLLCMGLGELATDETAPEVDLLRGAVLEAAAGRRDLRELLGREPLVARAHDDLRSWSDRLLLLSTSGNDTGVDELRTLVDRHAEPGAVLFVDYLQKVAVPGGGLSEDDKVTHVVEGLKDLALAHRVAVVAVTAADRQGIKAPRLHLHDLRGSSALAYECDIAVLLNDKHRIVSKQHLTFDPVRAATFRHQVVWSVEKNRGGPSLVDVEYRKHFSHFRFAPQGSYVAEKLIDGRVYTE